MKRMINARAIEFAGEELNTVPFDGTIRQSEAKASKYAFKPPLAAIIGTNQAVNVRMSAAKPIHLPFGDAFCSENRKSGARNTRDDGRTPADTPRTMAAGKIYPARPQ